MATAPPRQQALWLLYFQMNVEAELLPPGMAAVRKAGVAGPRAGLYAVLRSRNVDCVGRTMERQAAYEKVSWNDEMFTGRFDEGEDGCDVSVEVYVAGRGNVRDILLGAATHRVRRDHVNQTLIAGKKWGVRTTNGTAVVYIGCRYFQAETAQTPVEFVNQSPRAAHEVYPSPGGAARTPAEKPLRQGARPASSTPAPLGSVASTGTPAPSAGRTRFVPPEGFMTHWVPHTARSDPHNPTSERDVAGRKLHAFLAAHTPEKIPALPAMLDVYAGRELDLVAAYRTVHPWWDWTTDPAGIQRWDSMAPPAYAADTILREINVKPRVM